MPRTCKELSGFTRPLEEGEIRPLFNVLVMGPWFHGRVGIGAAAARLGEVAFGSNTAEFYSRTRSNCRFSTITSKERGSFRLPEASVFETGSNQWKSYEHWAAGSGTTRESVSGAGPKTVFSLPRLIKNTGNLR